MINIDYRKDKLLTEFSHKTLQDRYLVGDEVSPQEGFARAAQAFAVDEAHAQRLYDYASNLWLCLQPLFSPMEGLSGVSQSPVFSIM